MTLGGSLLNSHGIYNPTGKRLYFSICLCVIYIVFLSFSLSLYISLSLSPYPTDREETGNIDALKVVKASTTMTISWSADYKRSEINVPNGGIQSYQKGITLYIYIYTYI